MKNKTEETENKTEIKNITMTVIFEGFALNRDENLSGNIQSIKKLKRKDGVYSFIGKTAIRHYLFTTLNKYNPKIWEPAEVVLSKGEGGKSVVQFDITKDNILTKAELDAFGYMYTIPGKMSITRKSPVGITKAISLEPYEGDMAFYCNHDLVSRYKDPDVKPDPYNKEEHMSFFKVSFTIDVERFGEDEWIVNEKPKFNNNELKIELPDKKTKTISNVQQSNENEYRIQNGTIKIEQAGNKWKVIFELDKEKKKERICDILNAIRNGLYAQSSGVSNTIVPLFIIAAAVKVPSPIFYPYIHLARENGSYIVCGISDCLENGWIEKSNDGPIIYIYHTSRLKVIKKLPENSSNWEKFLENCGLK